jgi:hypothetical protein
MIAALTGRKLHFAFEQVMIRPIKPTVPTPPRSGRSDNSPVTRGSTHFLLRSAYFLPRNAYFRLRSA